MPRVLNARHVGLVVEGAVYVGRGSPWGNNWSHRKGTLAKHVVESLEEALRCYRTWVEAMPADRRAAFLAPLRGKDLVCWCAPRPCHADILVELANR